MSEEAAEVPRAATGAWRSIYTLAINTFKESVRQKVLLVLLLFSAVALAAGLIYSTRSPMAEIRALIDSSTSSIRFIGMLMAIFLGATLIPTETERRTIFTILAKPVTRGQLFLGKYFGALLTVLFNVCIMSIIFVALAIYKDPQHSIDPNIPKALLLICFELAVIAAIATALSTFCTVTFNLVCSFFIYFVGHLAEGIKYYSNPDVSGAFIGTLAGTIYYVLPHFENFDIRQAIISPDIVAPWGYMFSVCGAGVIYAVIALLIGYSIFSEREF